MIPIATRVLGFFLVVLLPYFSFSAPLTEAQARALFQRLSSQSLKKGTPLHTQVMEMAAQGRDKDIAILATQQPGFINSTVRYWGALMLSKDQVPAMALNDSLALVLGATKDNLDARELLTGNVLYSGDPRLGLGRPLLNNNVLYERLESASRDLSGLLVKVTPQWTDASMTDTAGILTTRGFAEINYSAGTNRRAVPAAFEAFLCQVIDTWKRPNLSTERIRQDIDRFPPGGPDVFQKECRTCHASMDAYAGAFAHLDFVNGTFTNSGKVVSKYTIHSDQYPDGYVTTDNSWINFLWEGPRQGVGAQQFGRMVTDFTGYSACLVKRTFQTVCHKKLSLQDTLVLNVAQEFRNEGHGLKDLFIKVALHSECKN